MVQADGRLLALAQLEDEVVHVLAERTVHGARNPVVDCSASLPGPLEQLEPLAVLRLHEAQKLDGDRKVLRLELWTKRECVRGKRPATKTLVSSSWVTPLFTSFCPL